VRERTLPQLRRATICNDMQMAGQLQQQLYTFNVSGLVGHVWQTYVNLSDSTACWCRSRAMRFCAGSSTVAARARYAEPHTCHCHLYARLRTRSGQRLFSNYI